MGNEAQTVLEWTYEPVNFFEEEERFSWSGGTINISDGSVRGEFDPGYYEQAREFRDQAHAAVLSRFMAQQVQTGKPYKLSLSSFAREHPDGRRDVTAFPETAVNSVTVGSTDVIGRDAKGNIVTDTKAERLATHRNFREHVARRYASDSTLRRMLQSYNNALRDPDNLLIHLYEIRDALTVEYGTETAARAAVGVSRSNWSSFGKMANDDPLLEGRHRGKKSGFRRLNTDELAFAKSFARELIEGYLKDKA